jgi:hypothetical protein
VICWDKIINETDTQSAYTDFHATITENFENCFPFKKVATNYSNQLPWLTPAIKNSISQKHKLYMKQLKINSQSNIATYKKFRNKLNHVLRITEREYYQAKIKEYQSNLRKSWKIINEVINRKKRTKIKK